MRVELNLHFKCVVIINLCLFSWCSFEVPPDVAVFKLDHICVFSPAFFFLLHFPNFKLALTHDRK